MPQEAGQSFRGSSVDESVIDVRVHQEVRIQCRSSGFLRRFQVAVVVAVADSLDEIPGRCGRCISSVTSSLLKFELVLKGAILNAPPKAFSRNRRDQLLES